MALKKGTVLVAKNYIKCYGIGRQFIVGTEFVYLFPTRVAIWFREVVMGKSMIAVMSCQNIVARAGLFLRFLEIFNINNGD